MTLGNILDRAYDVLGDVRNNPKRFQRDELVDLINEGCLVFRRFVEDKWFRHDEDTVASQSTYTFPSQSVRAIRVAYDDCTLRPTTMQELRGLDERWETREQDTPRLWTTQGQSHNQYRVYPIPSETTSDSFEIIADTNVSGWNAEHGIIGRWVDASGNDVTFNADTNVVGWDDEHGVLGATVAEVPFSSQNGALRKINATEVENFTLWLVQSPETISNDPDTIPIRDPFQIASLWYALWQTYEKEGDHHNSVLAAYYRDEFRLMVERARELMSMPFPFQKHLLGNDAISGSGLSKLLPFAPSGLDNDGNSINFGWPKGGL